MDAISTIFSPYFDSEGKTDLHFISREWLRQNSQSYPDNLREIAKIITHVADTIKTDDLTSLIDELTARPVAIQEAVSSCLRTMKLMLLLYGFSNLATQMNEPENREVDLEISQTLKSLDRINLLAKELVQ